MAQDVGPILEMVTDRYLLRSDAEWNARLEARSILDEILDDLRSGDVRAIGSATQRNFDGPIKTIIPWATNLYTETLIQEVRAAYPAIRSGDSGCWAGCRAEAWVSSSIRRSKPQAQERLGNADARTSASGLPAGFRLRWNRWSMTSPSTSAEPSPICLTGGDAVSAGRLLQPDASGNPAERSAAVDASGAVRSGAIQLVVPAVAMTAHERTRHFLDRLLPHARTIEDRSGTLETLLAENGFDPVQHERIQTELRAGQIGLAKNRLPASVQIDDVSPNDVFDAQKRNRCAEYRRMGEEALASGAVAVVTLAGGAGSRWTQGAGVVKALSPFCRLAGKHRTFLEVHLAKEPPRRPALRRCRSAHHHHQLSDPRAHAKHLLRPGRELRIRGAAVSFAGTKRGLAADPHGARSSLCVGGDCRSRCWMRRRRRFATVRARR